LMFVFVACIGICISILTHLGSTRSRARIMLVVGLILVISLELSVMVVSYLVVMRGI
jgi:hypothetical protein